MKNHSSWRAVTARNRNRRSRERTDQTWMLPLPSEHHAHGGCAVSPLLNATTDREPPGNAWLDPHRAPHGQQDTSKTCQEDAGGLLMG